MSNIPWDMAAGIIIAREAGAEIVDTDGTSHTMQSAATIGANPRLLAQLLPLLQAAAPPGNRETLVSPYAALDAILGRARHLIYDFDGVISEPAADLANAAPVPYVHEALAATSDSGRIVAIISRQPRSAISSWLDQHGLDRYAGHIATMPVRPASDSQDADRLVADVITDIGATTVDTAIITANPEWAVNFGVPMITYTAAPDSKRHTTSSAAGSAVRSLADLTLRLRARPLPKA
jgi:hypothetical protein